MRPWVNLASPQQLAAVDIPDTTHDSLIKQNLGDGGIAFLIIHDSINAFFEVGIRAGQIRTMPSENWMSTRIEILVRFDHGSIEADHNPIRHDDHDPGSVFRLFPTFADPI